MKLELSSEQRQRLAEAWRARGRVERPRPAPTQHAMSSDPCPYCQVPGFRGCDHFLPYQRPPRPEVREPQASFIARREFGPRASASKTLLADIEAFLREHQMRAWLFGNLAGLGSGFVAGVRNGRTVTMGIEARARAFMDSYEGEAG